MTVTRQLAMRAAALRFGDLSAEDVAAGKRLLLDGLGCLIAGTVGPTGKSAADMVTMLGATGEASTIFTGMTRGTARDAAFVNGVTLYSVGLNDLHEKSGAHPGGCVIPVLLAIGEWKNSPGGDVLAAMAGGYEVGARIGGAISSTHRKRGFHPTGTVGTFSATASAGRLLGLNGEQMACAFGIAGSQAAGLYEFHHDGTLTMIFHAGRAAQNGVEAAVLTLTGMTGPAAVLEGEEGFFRATADEVDLSVVTNQPDRLIGLATTRFRPYYGCSSTIAASGATADVIRHLDLRDPADIAEVVVACHPVPAASNDIPEPTTLLAARLSMQYNVALVLMHGNVLARDLTEDDLWNPRIRALLPRIRLVADGTVPRHGTSMTFRLKDGRAQTIANPTPLGSQENPMSWDDIVVKFLRLTEGVAPEARTRPVVDVVAKFETMTSRDLIAAMKVAVSG